VPTRSSVSSGAFGLMTAFMKWPLAWRLGVAVVAVGVTICFRLIFLAGLEGRLLYITMFPAILASALVGGASGGFLAVALSMVVAHVFGAPLTAREELVGGAVFFVSSSLIVGVIIWLRSVLEQFAAAEATRQTDELGQFVEQAPVAMAMFDREMRYLAASARWRASHGLQPYIIGKSHYDTFPGMPERWKVAHQRGLAGEVLRADEDCVTRPDGSVQWLRWEVRPWRQPSDEIGGITIFVEDVTVRKLAQDSLRDSERRLKAMFETAMEAIVVIDQRGRILSVNPVAEAQFGYAANELLGQNVSILMPSPQREGHDGYLAAYLSSGERKIIGQRRRVQGRRKNGELFPLETAVSQAEIGDEVIFVGFLRDQTEMVNEKRRAEAAQTELLHLSRLSDMGEVAAWLAHEVSQPLTAILNFAAVAGKRLADDNAASVPHLVGLIETQAKRAADILSRLRRFIEKRESICERENINHLVEEALALAVLRTSAQSPCLVAKPPSEVIEVNVDRVQIQQVLFNFLRNAADAVADQADAEIGIATEMAGPKFVRVTISDNGPGVDPEVAGRLFSPFVTTKASGMGIGLSLCKSIIESHGGQIGYSARSPRGAAFYFTLPLIEGEAEVSTT